MLSMAGCLLIPSSSFSAPPRLFDTPNLSYVAGIPYGGGSDLEFQDRSGPSGTRSYLYAGSLSDYGSDAGLRIVDITDPTSPVLESFLSCSTNQNDVQVFERSSRTYVVMGLDYDGGAAPSPNCFTQLGIPRSSLGIVAIDVTDVENPVAVGWLEVETGAHNVTMHPAGRYLYVSDAEIVGSYDDFTAVAQIQVIDMVDPTTPVLVDELTLPPGGSSHDITFSVDGSRAYSAALTQTVILDTSNPAAPSLLSLIEDPSINIHHQADPFESGGRDYLVITDELAGAAGNGSCPGGGLHVYDITNESLPIKVSFFVIPDVSVYGLDTRFRCTAHVLKIYPDQDVLTIAWYEAGSWVIDISDPYRFRAVKRAVHRWAGNEEAWAAKLWNGFLFVNDIAAGIQIFRYETPAGAPSDATVDLMDPPASPSTRGSRTLGPRLFCFEMA